MSINVMAQKTLDMSEIAGEEHIKRALEVAATAQANVLLIGPPGSGKTMFTHVYGNLINSGVTTGIIGVSVGDSIKDVKTKFNDCDGQETLIVVDELPELKRNVMYYIRELSHDYSIPVIATMHPCPCGYFSDPRHQCVCTPKQIMNYRSKISGSILEMFDICIEVTGAHRREIDDLIKGRKAETTEDVLSRIIPAYERYKQNREKLEISEDASRLLSTAVERLGFSMRRAKRIIQIARVIADLDSEDNVKTHHLAEAIQYRAMDRQI